MVVSLSEWRMMSMDVEEALVVQRSTNKPLEMTLTAVTAVNRCCGKKGDDRGGRIEIGQLLVL